MIHSEILGDGDFFHLKTYYYITISSSTCMITFLYHLRSFCGVSVAEAQVSHMS